MASSTRIPIEKIRANKLTRSIVKPNNQAANTVTVITTGMIIKVTKEALQPRNSNTNTVTIKVASPNLNISSSTLAFADAP